MKKKHITQKNRFVQDYVIGNITLNSSNIYNKL